MLPYCLPVGTVPADVQEFDVGQVVRLALALSGKKPLILALEMGLTEGQLSRQLSGCGPEHLSLHRLSRAKGLEFRLALVFFWGRAWGLWEGWEPVLDRVMRGRLTMAKASLTKSAAVEEKERVTA
jgi:hypothetical protein